MQVGVGIGDFKMRKFENRFKPNMCGDNESFKQSYHKTEDDLKKHIGTLCTEIKIKNERITKLEAQLMSYRKIIMCINCTNYKNSYCKIQKIDVSETEHCCAFEQLHNLMEG